jgi:hypothetical protein
MGKKSSFKVKIYYSFLKIMMMSKNNKFNNFFFLGECALLLTLESTNFFAFGGHSSLHTTFLYLSL